MRYNAKYHQQADEYARQLRGENAFAVYMGHYKEYYKNGKVKNEYLNFLAHHGDSQEYTDETNIFILINDKGVKTIGGGLDFVPMPAYDYLKKGRNLVRKLIETQGYTYTDNEDDRQYYIELYNALQGWYDVPIPLTDMQLFMQESLRLGRKIEIKPKPETMGRMDGWEYYLKLV